MLCFWTQTPRSVRHSFGINIWAHYIKSLLCLPFFLGDSFCRKRDTNQLVWGSFWPRLRGTQHFRFFLRTSTDSLYSLSCSRFLPNHHVLTSLICLFVFVSIVTLRHSFLFLFKSLSFYFMRYHSLPVFFAFSCFLLFPPAPFPLPSEIIAPPLFGHPRRDAMALKGSKPLLFVFLYIFLVFFSFLLIRIFLLKWVVAFSLVLSEAFRVF